MKPKRVLRAVMLFVASATVMFLFTPSLVRAIYSSLTPRPEIEALQRHYRHLDAAESQLSKAQQKLSAGRRVAISDWLAIRGVAIDPGIRDEGVEHASLFWRLYGMTLWEWTDMLRYWQSPTNLRTPAQLTLELL